ncbi:MAG: hypothetical protein K940chlam8_00152 [Chlamydiae bacterium]|nr:hypothetical protein [Chlamydiota bacterium]
MAPKLVAESGLLKGKVYSLEGQEEYILGRDPDLANIVLEDPSVSRKHLLITETDEGFFAQNLSLINPSLLDDKPLKEKMPLQDGQVLQIGSTHFRYTTTFDETFKVSDQELDTIFEEDHKMPTSFDFSMPPPSRYLLKVLSGPNAGAEFFMEKNKPYKIGKDPLKCDIIFYDRSVSSEHASIEIKDDGTILIKDLDSRNGVFVSGVNVDEDNIAFQDVVSLGTTTFVVIDTEQEQPTIISPVPREVRAKKEAKPISSWKKIFVPTQDLAIASVFTLIVLIIGVSMLMLFKGTPKEIAKIDHTMEIKNTLQIYPSLEFTYNNVSKDLFLVGHLSTEVEKDQMLFELGSLSFLNKIDDNVVVDELIWQEMNSIFAKNSDWQSVTMYSPGPGQFVVSGYLDKTGDVAKLQDFINLNFNFVDQLKNEVYADDILTQAIDKMLAQNGFFNVQSSFADGGATLQGSINSNNEKNYLNLLNNLRHVDGIRKINDLVVVQKQQQEDAISLGSQFVVSGVSKQANKNVNVIINGKIYFLGEGFEGMTIVKILQDEVLLEKDGLKYKINYTL